MIKNSCVRETPFDYAKHSSIGCGGSAPVAFYPQSVEELTALVLEFQSKGISFTVLGNLTNVLPPEGASPTLVVSTKRLTGIEETGQGVFALAGVTSGGLLKACKNLRLSGAEFLEGIPCTLGGAL